MSKSTAIFILCGLLFVCKVTFAADNTNPVGIRNIDLGIPPSDSTPGVWDFKSIKVQDEWKMQWVPRGGIPTLGMFARTWGKVRAAYSSPTTGAKWFYIDDGAGVVSDFGDIGVIVYSDADVKIGDYIAVNGMSQVEESFDQPGKMIRVVRCFNQQDVQLINRPEPVALYPFSDEFDSQTLDSRWFVPLLKSGTISTTTRPGWLTFTLKKASEIALTQQIPEFWDIYTKVSIDINNGHSGRFQLYTHNKDYVFWYNVGTSIYREAESWTLKLCGITWPMQIQPPNNEVIIHLQRKSTGCIAEYSFDGIEWNRLAETVNLPAHRFVTLYVIGNNSTTYTGSNVYVDYFRLTQLSD